MHLERQSDVTFTLTLEPQFDEDSGFTDLKVTCQLSPSDLAAIHTAARHCDKVGPFGDANVYD